MTPYQKVRLPGAKLGISASRSSKTRQTQRTQLGNLCLGFAAKSPDPQESVNPDARTVRDGRRRAASAAD